MNKRINGAAVCVAMVVIILMFAGLFNTPLAAAAQPPLEKTAKKRQRNYMMVFDVAEYSSQLKEAVTSFFNDVFLKGDQLIVVTPVKLVGYSAQKLRVPKKKMIAAILELLKRDIADGSKQKRDILSEMLRIAQIVARPDVFEGPVNHSQTYVRLRKRLVEIRGSYKDKLIKYSNIFRKVRGDNNLLMFLEREYRPIPDKESMELMKTSTQFNTGASMEDTFLGEDTYKSFNLKEIIPVFKYAYIRFHFLYLKGKNVRPTRDIDYVDNMGEIYSNFSKLAKATNGVKLTSIKPASFAKLLRKALIQGKVETEVVDQSVGK